MRIRIPLVAAAVAVAVVLTMSACASTVAGTPQAGAAPVTGLPTDTALPTDDLPTDVLPSDTGLPTDDTALHTDTALPTDELPTDTAVPTDELPTDTALPTDDLPTDDLPTDATEFPGGTELPTSIPGLSPECNQVYGIVVFFSNVLTQDTPITQEQVDAAFGDASDYPSEIQADITALHDVATKMVGKSGTEALMEIGTTDASTAMTNLSTYLGKVCKYGG